MKVQLGVKLKVIIYILQYNFSINYEFFVLNYILTVSNSKAFLMSTKKLSLLLDKQKLIDKNNKTVELDQ